MKSSAYKFLGPHGPFILIIIYPLIVLSLVTAVNFYRDLNFRDDDLKLKVLFQILREQKSFTLSSIFAVLGWLSLQSVLYKNLPGEEVLGLPSSGNKPLKYTVNGLSSLFSTVVLIAAVYILQGKNVFLWVVDNLFQLCVASAVVSSFLSIAIYCYSFRKGASIIENNNTKFFIYDFWMGRELNPRIFDIDLKHFFYTRIGLMGTFFLTFCFLIKHYDEMDSIKTSQLLVFITQALYACNTLYNESSFLTTSYVTKDGLGYMLCSESILIMPFLYSIQANYLVTRQVNMPIYVYHAILLLNFIGLYVMQSSNNQKDYFHRSIIAGKKSIEPKNYRIAKDGKPLLFSGWWGLARHINYCGYWLVFLTISLLAGFSSIIPYSGFIYINITLLYRQYLEESYCKIKKGSVWREYCKAVPWRFIPYIT